MPGQDEVRSAFLRDVDYKKCSCMRMHFLQEISSCMSRGWERISSLEIASLKKFWEYVNGFCTCSPYFQPYLSELTFGIRSVTGRSQTYGCTAITWCVGSASCSRRQNYCKVTVAERSKACTVFAGSEAGIVDSNPTQGIDVSCLCVWGVFCVCVQVEALRRADHPPKESYRMSKI
jgi:hypothetical protein